VSSDSMKKDVKTNIKTALPSGATEGFPYDPATLYSQFECGCLFTLSRTTVAFNLNFYLCVLI
jgi:hypothetical protein